MRNFKKTLATALAAIIVFSSLPVHAASFPDVPDSHWASSYVESMKSLSYLKGYTDGTFKPEKNITFSELMKVLNSFHSVTTSNTQSAADIKSEVFFKYDNKTLNAILSGVPDWAKDAVLYNLNEKIVSINDLTATYNAKAFSKPINRVNTMTFLAKAMRLEEKANALLVVSLPYTDAGKVDKLKAKYISVLLDAGVLSPQGKGNGALKPADLITRAEMTKMLSIGDGYVRSGTPTPTPTPVPTPTPAKGNARGTITSITNVGAYSLLSIQTTDGKSMDFKLPLNAEIKLEAKTVTYAALEKGQEVDIIYDMNSVTKDVLSVEAMTKEQPFEGSIVSISSDLTKFTVKTNSGEKTYTVDNSSSIQVNGKSSSLRDVLVNDVVKGTVKNELLLKMDVEKLDRYEGKVLDVNYRRDEISLQYTVNNVKKTNWFAVDRDVKILIDGKEAILKDIRTEAPITLVVKNDKLVRLEASRFREFKGYIDDIKMSTDKRSADITIVLDDSRNTINLKIDRYTRFVREGSSFNSTRTRQDVDELQKRDYVEIRADYEIITDIKATYRADEVRGFITKISEVWQGRPEVTVNIGSNKVETYTLARDAQIEIDGKTNLNASNLVVGMDVRMDIQNNEIIRVIGYTSSLTKPVSGEVVYAREQVDYYDLEIVPDRSTERVRVRIPKKDDVFIRNYSQSDFIRDIQDFNKYNTKFYLTVIGKYDGYIIVADTVYK